MKKIFAIAALMLASLSVNAHTFQAQWLNECTSVGTVSFEFKSEKVCSQYDDHDYDENGDVKDHYFLVYHDPYYCLDHEVLEVDYDLSKEWELAVADNRIVRVRIMWNAKEERFEMVPWTLVTWDCEQDIIYPEM